MNETIKDLISRRSTRSYRPDPIPTDILKKIIEAGTYAPTGRNKQSPIILAITDKKVRDKISALNAAVMGSEDDPFYGAPVILIVLADKSVGTYLYDGSLVMGNLLNAAHAMGISSCWIHRAKEVFESNGGKEILRSVGVDPERYEGIGNCILGYAADRNTVDASPRKDNYVYYI